MSLLKEHVPDKTATEQLNGFLLLLKSCEYLYSFPWKKRLINSENQGIFLCNSSDVGRGGRVQKWWVFPYKYARHAPEFPSREGEAQIMFCLQKSQGRARSEEGEEGRDYSCAEFLGVTQPKTLPM